MRKTVVRKNTHNLPRPWTSLGSAPSIGDASSPVTRSTSVLLAPEATKKGKTEATVNTTTTIFTTQQEISNHVNGSILLKNTNQGAGSAPAPTTLHSKWEDPVLIHVNDYLQRSVRLQKKMYEKYRRVTNAKDEPLVPKSPKGKKTSATLPYDPEADAFVSEFDSEKCGVVEMEVRLGQLGFTRNVTVDARNQSLWESTVEDTADKKAVAPKKTVNAHTNEETTNSQQQQKHRQLQAQKRQGFRVATAPIESAAVLENNTYMFNSGFRVLSSCDEFFSIPFKIPFRQKKNGFTLLCVERSTRRTNTKGIRKIVGFNMWSRLFTRDMSAQKKAWLMAAYKAAFISVDDRSYEEVRRAVDDFLRVSQPERYSETAMASRADISMANDDGSDEFEVVDANVGTSPGEEGEDVADDDVVEDGGIPQTREEAIARCREFISRKVRIFSFAATEAAVAAQQKLQQSQQHQKSASTKSNDESEEGDPTKNMLLSSEEVDDQQSGAALKELLKEGDKELRALQGVSKERFVSVAGRHDEEDAPTNALTWKQRRQFDLLLRRPGEISMDGSDEMIQPPVTWGRVGAVSPVDFYKTTGVSLEPRRPLLDANVETLNLPTPDVMWPTHLEVGTTFEAHALTDDGYRLEFMGGVPLAAVLDAKSNTLSILMTRSIVNGNKTVAGPQSPALTGADKQSAELIAHLRSKYNVEEIVFDSFVIEPGQEQTKYAYVREYVERKLREGDVSEIDTTQLMMLPRSRPLDVAAAEAPVDKGGFGGVGGASKGSKALSDPLLIKDVAIDFSAPIKKSSQQPEPSAAAEVSIFNTQPTTPVDLYLLCEQQRREADANSDAAEEEALFGASSSGAVANNKSPTPRPSVLEAGSFVGGECTMVAFTNPRTVRKSAISHFDIRQPRWCADARISVSIERTHEESTGAPLPHPSKMVPNDADLMIHRKTGTEDEEYEWGVRMGRSIAVTRLRKRMMFRHHRVLPVLSGMTVGLTDADPMYPSTIASIAAATQKLSPLIAPHVLHTTTGKAAKKTSKGVTPEAIAQAEKSYESLMSPEDATYRRVVQYFLPFFFHTKQEKPEAPCRRLLRWNLQGPDAPSTVKRQTSSYPTAVEFELSTDIVANEFLRPCITDVVSQRRPRVSRTRLPSHATTVKQLQEEYGATDKKELLAMMKEQEDAIGHIPSAIRLGATDGMMCLRTHPSDERSREVEVEVDVAALTKTVIAADRALNHRIGLIENDATLDAATKATILTFVRHEHNQRVADLYTVVSRCFMETIGDIAKLS